MVTTAPLRLSMLSNSGRAVISLVLASILNWASTALLAPVQVLWIPPNTSSLRMVQSPFTSDRMLEVHKLVLWRKKKGATRPSLLSQAGSSGALVRKILPLAGICVIFVKGMGRYSQAQGASDLCP